MRQHQAGLPKSRQDQFLKNHSQSMERRSKQTSESSLLRVNGPAKVGYEDPFIAKESEPGKGKEDIPVRNASWGCSDESLR